VSRAALTAQLVEAVRARPGARIHFGQQCTGYEGKGTITLRDTASGREYTANAARIIGADGAGSALRHALASHSGFEVTEARLPHDYKELLIPLQHGRPALPMDALHIWPRGGHMLIALPNADGTFTATLFLPREAGAGQPGFDQLHATTQIRDFFSREFSDVPALIPDLEAQFQAHPQGMLGTVHCPQWHDREHLLLIGDAAHAIVPFHGQGMNCAFEDCRLLDQLLASGRQDAFTAFAADRREDCEAIAQMALENYGEMRDTVRDPLFQQHKQLSLALERAFPDRFIPRYSMVMFHDRIPYATALHRGRIQLQLLELLTAPGTALTDEAIAALVHARLPALESGASG
jgi:kynurenine 3-monooxygenase